MTMSQGKGRTLAPTRYAHDESSGAPPAARSPPAQALANADRKSTRLNSSHSQISYAVFCLKKKKKTYSHITPHDFSLIDTIQPPQLRLASSRGTRLTTLTERQPPPATISLPDVYC